MKILGGKFKGRSLKSAGPATRPTQAIMRGAFFNICQHYIEGAHFLDCFAGSGAMGFEALSRGASRVTFIEQDKVALQALRQNIALLHVEAQVELLPYKAERALAQLEESFSLIYLDPPYALPVLPYIEQILRRYLLKEGGFLFIEKSSIKEEPPIQGLKLISRRTFGAAALEQYQFLSQKI
ncbi:MAG: 16S rRNA (guanine(966)-N(2))-methyltransferase RsmD [Verrucomicrobiota bacterium]|nr:16S rRNA (guanine(966)-N(2))-methyltransferase RsmD [Verrucomicrobiota bacterium]